MEYKGNITLPTYEQYCDGLFNYALDNNKKVRCSDCDGEGFIIEELLSKQGNWHEIEEVCETCGGEGEVSARCLDKPANVASFGEYRESMIDEVKKLSAWTNTDFFLNLGKVKQIFK